jgi:choline dehydrogenase-like flavoprotein
LWHEDGTAHLLGTCQMGSNRNTGATNADGRSWDIPNLWICDGSLFEKRRGCRFANDPGDRMSYRRLDRSTGPLRRTLCELSVARTYSCRLVRSELRSRHWLKALDVPRGRPKGQARS